VAARATRLTCEWIEHWHLAILRRYENNMHRLLEQSSSAAINYRCNVGIIAASRFSQYEQETP
jgi:hypothetical protein